MLTKDKARRTLILIFVGLILLLINLSFTINIGDTSLSLGVASLIGLILILVATLDVRKYLKSANIGFYIAIVALVCTLIPVLNILILNNIQPQVEYMQTLIKSINPDQVDYNAVNNIFSTLENISGIVVGMMAISTLPSSIALGAMIYYSGEMVNEICLQRGLFYSDKVKRNTRLATIFMLIANALAFLTIACLMDGASKIRFDVEAKTMILDSVGSLAIGTILLLPTIAIAICYLVFFIKLIVSISRVIDDNNKKTDKDISITESDIIENE